MISTIRKELRSLRNPARAKLSARYFKTGKGEYGEGDVFLGITVPNLRKLAKKYKGIAFADTLTFLRSITHEERLLALFFWIDQYERGNEKERKQIFHAYVNSMKYINNWDLIDVSAGRIVGVYLDRHPRGLLFTFAKSKNLWKRRVAIIATSYFIAKGECADTLEIAELLLADKHDLIHKAVGWMLREVGNRCSLEAEEAFLKEHYHSMPRTMLRYAIEKFPEAKRQKYLKGKM